MCGKLISSPTLPSAEKHAHANGLLDSVQEDAVNSLFSRPPDSPGYAVAIMKDGQFAFAKGYGLANLDDKVPITADTSFHLASVSKQFTAAAIALLILDGKIALSDPVAKYLPEVAKYGNGLRIEHLIYMTSGLHEYHVLQLRACPFPTICSRKFVSSQNGQRSLNSENAYTAAVAYPCMCLLRMLFAKSAGRDDRC
jgi:CubicO group peptidase (beta-lactamase class C family)